MAHGLARSSASSRPSGTRTAVAQAAAISSRAGQSSSPRALTPFAAGAGDGLMTIDEPLHADVQRLVQHRFQAVDFADRGRVGEALVPSSQAFFQSRIERKLARNGSGWRASSASQAAGLIDISERPGVPPRHFWGPAMAISMPHSSGLSSSPPSPETVSTMVSHAELPRDWPISLTGLWVPEGVSEWTTERNLMPGLAWRALRTSSGSMASL